MRVGILLLFIFLTGCVTFGQLEQGLSYMMGRHESVAFEVLGYPSGKQEFNGDTVYYWSNRSTGAVFIPQTSTTYGNVGNTPVYGSTTYNQVVPVSHQCEIKMIADPKGVLKRWEYNGNKGGCKMYIKRVHQYYKASNP